MYKCIMIHDELSHRLNVTVSGCDGHDIVKEQRSIEAGSGRSVVFDAPLPHTLTFPSATTGINDVSITISGSLDCVETMGNVRASSTTLNGPGTECLRQLLSPEYRQEFIAGVSTRLTNATMVLTTGRLTAPLRIAGLQHVTAHLDQQLRACADHLTRQIGALKVKLWATANIAQFAMERALQENDREAALFGKVLSTLANRPVISQEEVDIVLKMLTEYTRTAAPENRSDQDAARIFEDARATIGTFTIANVSTDALYHLGTTGSRRVEGEGAASGVNIKATRFRAALWSHLGLPSPPRGRASD